MKTTLKRSMEPQATRLTFVLLAVVMIGFGLLAEHHVPAKNPQVLTGQIITTNVLP